VSFTLSQVVPWGRTFEEYRALFALTDNDLVARILGCGDGPASVIQAIRSEGLAVSRVRVPYEFQKGANETLRILG